MRGLGRASIAGLAASAVLAACAGGIEAQLASRIDAVEDGTVRFGYRARPDVEVCEQGVRMGDHQIWWRSRHGDHEGRNCRAGYVELEVRRSGAAVRAVELVRGFETAGPDVTDLGEVEPREAVRALTALAREGAEDAVLPAFLADVPDPWPGFFDLAHDRSLRTDVRKATIFWLGQAAADAVTEGLTALAVQDEEEQEIRDAAVFALSQRPGSEAVPALMELARDAEQAETRRTALFWLAQSGDPRVVPFFEEILLGRGP